jgi:hypothetical protein
VKLIFKNNFFSQRKHIARIKWLMLFKEIINVYSENDTKHINTLWAQYISKSSPTTQLWRLRGGEDI